MFEIRDTINEALRTYAIRDDVIGKIQYAVISKVRKCAHVI